MNVNQHIVMPFSKIVVAGALAMVTTLFLFAVMHQLIFRDFQVPEDVEPTTFPNVTYSKPTKDRVKETLPEPPIDPPTPPESLDPPEVDPGQVSFTPTQPVIKTIKGPDLSILGSSSFPVARILTTPVYPRRASQRAIEGYVDVYFDVTKFGATENISVQAAEPPGFFEESAVRAVKRWRFQPVVKDGEPVAYTGMVRRVTYKMQK